MSNRHHQRAVDAVAHRMQITDPVEREIHLVGREAVLALAAQYVFEDQLAQQPGFVAAAEIDGLDFTVMSRSSLVRKK